MENRLLREALKKQKQLEDKIIDLQFTNSLLKEENDYLHKNYMPKCVVKNKIIQILKELLEENE
jgi:hypothetical protein